MKKRLAILFVLCMMFALIPVQAFAATPGDSVSPYASVTINGGLVYDTSEQAYYMLGECFGASEYKTLVIDLYKQVNGDWEFVDSQIACGTENHLTAEKKVSITSGYYKLVISATSPTSSGSVPHYYNV